MHTILNKTLIKKGGFGSIYKANYRSDSEHSESQKVVLKYVPCSNYRVIESDILKAMASSNASYNNKLIEEWKEEVEGKEHHVFCLQKLGKSLLDLHKPIKLRVASGTRFCANKLSIQCILQIGIQVTKALREIHDKGFLHLDVKPNNILTAYDFSAGSNELSKIEDLDKNVFLIDYGLAEPYNDENGIHRPQKSGHPTCGSYLFLSYNALMSKC